MNRGFWSALGAYLLWGLLPIYWKLVQSVPAYEILSHRTVWSLVLLLILLAYQRNWGWLRPTLTNRRTALTFLVASLLLAINWGTYIWAVNSNYVVETSLGYFINPLVNVAFGFIFLKETMRSGQKFALVFALLGVLYLTWNYGQPPWISLTLAFSWATYGLLKKQSSLKAIEGLSLETAMLVVPMGGYLIWLQMTGEAAFVNAGASTTLLLMGAGIATAIPLLMFGYGAQRITLTTLGLLQYVAPSMQFLIGVYIYGESFPPSRLLGFGLIWLALVIYSAETIHNHRQTDLSPQQATV